MTPKLIDARTVKRTCANKRKIVGIKYVILNYSYIIKVMIQYKYPSHVTVLYSG